MSNQKRIVMKKLLLALVTISTIVFSVNAQAESVFSGSVDFGIYHDYMPSVSGQPFYEGFLPQQSVTLMHKPSGISACAWNSVSLNGEKDGGDETDLTVTITRKFGNLSIDAGYAYWAITGPDLHDVFVNADYQIAEKTALFFCIDQVIPTKAEELEGGVLHKFGVKQTFSVEGQEFNLKVFVGGHDGAFGSKPEHFAIGRCDLSTTFDVVGKLTATPSLCLQVPINEDCKTRLFGNVSFSIPFGEE